MYSFYKLLFWFFLVKSVRVATNVGTQCEYCAQYKFYYIFIKLGIDYF